MTTAGSEGFLNLMPIYLDHVLYPTLTVCQNFYIDVDAFFEFQFCFFDWRLPCTFDRIRFRNLLTSLKCITLMVKERMQVLYTVRCRIAKIQGKTERVWHCWETCTPVAVATNPRPAVIAKPPVFECIYEILCMAFFRLSNSVQIYFNLTS